MNHPEEALAGYVDGSLAPSERAEVDLHLASCERCREEVAMARGAMRALGALEDRPVPFGVTGPVLAEAGRRTERRGVTWRRFQWAAGLAAAAALVAIVALNLTGGGTGGEAGGAATRAGGGSAAATHVRLERQPNVEYDGDAGVRALAGEAAARFAARQTRSSAALSAPEAAAQDTAASGGVALENPRPAVRCLGRAGVPFDDPASRLVRLIEARFVDAPAYFAVFLQGPGAGQPPDRAVVWVVSREGCTLLNASSLPF